jgi:hypothetical protein
MTLEDVCSVVGRNPTVEEFRSLGVLTKSSERKSPHVVAALAAKLQYQNSIMYGTDFMGAFTFLNIFSFWIYHVFLVIGGTVVGVYPAWLALLKMPTLWLPLTLSIVTKKLLSICIARRILSRPGDEDDLAGHRGIRYLQAFSVFEALYTALSAILGWATAATRMATSVFWAILMFPRVDILLTGGASLDSSYQTFLGVMSATRLRAEFAVTVMVRSEMNERELPALSMDANGDAASKGEEMDEEEEEEEEEADPDLRVDDGVVDVASPRAVAALAAGVEMTTMVEGKDLPPPSTTSSAPRRLPVGQVQKNLRALRQARPGF